MIARCSVRLPSVAFSHSSSSRCSPSTLLVRTSMIWMNDIVRLPVPAPSDGGARGAGVPGGPAPLQAVRSADLVEHGADGGRAGTQVVALAIVHRHVEE